MAKATSKSGSGRVGSERPDIRLTTEQMSLIERAAMSQGRTVADFVLTSVLDAARRAIEAHQRIELSMRDSETFVEALLKPNPINDRLRDTVRRFRETTGN